MSSEFIHGSANLPPRAAATDLDFSVMSAATAVTASSVDLWAGYAADPSGNKSAPGKLWLELEATGFDCYVRFTRTALTATTAANGSVIRAGVPRLFYVFGEVDKFLDIISPGGVGAIKWRKCSTIVERSRQ